MLILEPPVFEAKQLRRALEYSDKAHGGMMLVAPVLEGMHIAVSCCWLSRCAFRAGLRGSPGRLLMLCGFTGGVLVISCCSLGVVVSWSEM